MNNLGRKLSTGSNWMDAGLGGAIGFADAFNNQKGYYVPQGIWKGNGLADTRLGYMENPNYRNYYDQGQMMSSLLHNRNRNQQSGFNFGNGLKDILGRLSRLRGNNNYGIVGEEVDNYVNDRPSYSALSSAINNEVMY